MYICASGIICYLSRFVHLLLDTHMKGEKMRYSEFIVTWDTFPLRPASKLGNCYFRDKHRGSVRYIRGSDQWAITCTRRVSNLVDE